MEEILNEVIEQGLEEYLNVELTPIKGLFIVSRTSDNCAVIVSKDATRCAAFVRGVAEGFQMGKDWAY